MESLRVMDAGTTPSNDGLVQLCNNLQSEERSIGFLEDLESYLQEINDRLTISRMVSDSVIRGIVNAIKEEADEKIAQKELEVAGLKKMLHLHHVDTDKNESLGPCLLCDESKISTYHKMYYNFPDAFVENDRMREYLHTLRNAAEDQFKMLKKEIDRLRGPSSIRRITSGSELPGLGGILQDKVSERRTDADIMLENLKATIDTVCKQVDDMLQLPKASFCAWQQEQEFQDDIEGMVIKNCIRSLQEEFEERLWDQNARLCGNESVDWLEKLQEVSNLRQELDAISKSLSVHEIGQLTSLGSLEIGGEWNNNKRTENFNRKVLSNHVSSSTLAWEGNGKHEDTNANAAENSDPGKLKSMSKDKLVAEMTQMRRNHESKVQDLTEENIRLKGELLKLQKRGSSLPSEKDKEFEMLKKKIPNFISKLDDILMKNGNLLAFNGTAENLSSLKERLESLLSENRQLRDLLSDKKKEVNCLSSQVSDAEDKMSQHHLIEANLEHAIEDAHIKDSIIEDVYKCVLRELLCQIKCITEESDLRCNIMLDIYELLFSEAVCISQPANKYEIEDSDMDSIIAQTLCGIIFREALKDAEEKISSLNTRYTNEKEQRVSLEVEAVERKEALRLEFLEKGRLQQEIRSLVASVAEKEKLVHETTAALAKEKEQFELASQDLENSRDQTNRLQSLLLERGKEENIINGNLVQALKEIAQYKEGMCELNKKLERIDEEKGTLHEEKLKALSLVKVKEMEHRKQMESLVQVLLKSAADFENRVMENVSNISLRLEKLVSESCLLIPNAVGLRRMGLSYKQKLERRCSDLEKAEAEVDLLGDEVDALLSLLEKIYIALDHYSPILQHYPGITEILKLVKRELSGECTKVV